MGFEIDINDSIDNAMSEENFDVLAFVSGAATPEHSVVLYTDADAALKTARSLLVEQERIKQNKSDDYSITDAVEEEEDVLSEEELDELHTRLIESAITVELKGLAPAALKALENSLKAKHTYKEGAANEEYNEALEFELTARSIKSVTSPKGVKNTQKWDAEKIEALYANLYPSEQNKLLSGVIQMNYVAAIFDKAVTADFS